MVQSKGAATMVQSKGAATMVQSKGAAGGTDAEVWWAAAGVRLGEAAVAVRIEGGAAATEGSVSIAPQKELIWEKMADPALRPRKAIRVTRYARTSAFLKQQSPRLTPHTRPRQKSTSTEACPYPAVARSSTQPQWQCQTPPEVPSYPCKQPHQGSGRAPGPTCVQVRDGVASPWRCDGASSRPDLPSRPPVLTSRPDLPSRPEPPCLAAERPRGTPPEIPDIRTPEPSRVGPEATA
ncbi:hypothetical protein C4D60_Mb04t16520 [Musa balbisiana]|uniref:Uncharacterized protein n=1 Tax=Musa balbisiana TaxID=52838 RepID=A0A4S8KCI7_MUSBA|nr:hypothetical protein C4D60_Mb04t16520 [Musa balbisiana]